MNSVERLTVTCTDGAQIEVRRYVKSGAPRLVLSHGNGFAIGGYAKFWELLLPDYELCLFDLRNHGGNRLTPLPAHNLSAMASDHAAVRAAIERAFGPRRTIGLFHSISSIAAIRAALDNDLHWDGLILYDPPLIAPEGNPLRAMNRDLDGMLSDFALKRQHYFQSIDELAQHYRQRPGRNWVQGAEFDMASATLGSASQGGYELCCPGEYEAKIYSENAGYESFEALARINQTAFLICADPQAPRALPPAFSGAQAAAQYRLPYVSIPGAGHMLQIENPAAAAHRTCEFITQILNG